MTDDFINPYPEYDVLDKWDTPSWDDYTREIVALRLDQVPPRRFLEPEEYLTLEAACHRLLPQPDREHPVPIAPWIDEKLHADRKDGYRFEGMPPLRDAWKLGLRGIDDEARARFGDAFRALDAGRQDEVLSCIQQGETRSAVWDELPAKKFFSDHLLTECVAIYYAHPAAWSEIGFGGPASPRGYARRRGNLRDGWEAPLSKRWDEIDDATA